MCQRHKPPQPRVKPWGPVTATTPRSSQSPERGDPRRPALIRADDARCRGASFQDSDSLNVWCSRVSPGRCSGLRRTVPLALAGYCLSGIGDWCGGVELQRRLPAHGTRTRMQRRSLATSPTGGRSAYSSLLPSSWIQRGKIENSKEPSPPHQHTTETITTAAS